MGFIERELQRIERLLIREDGSIDERVYAAQQALGWALDPKAYKSPADYLKGIASGSEGCSVEIRHSPLPNTIVDLSDGDALLAKHSAQPHSSKSDAGQIGYTQ